MSQLFNNEQKLNDIIFANRNQAYGAYALRSAYGNTIFKSILLMLVGVGAVFSTAFYFSNKNNPNQDYSEILLIRDSIYVIPFNNEKDEKPEKLEEPKKEEPKKQEEPSATKSESVVIIDSSFTAKTTTTEIVGPVKTSTLVGDLATIPNKGSLEKGTSTLGTDSNKVVEPYGVDTAPEFEGGLNALYKFVIRHLTYPEIASSYGKGGTVYVKFVVDETGKVGKLTLLNSVGYGMDEEALRVVSMIPKFKSPAKVKGQAVKTYFQLPIRFRQSN